MKETKVSYEVSFQIVSPENNICIEIFKTQLIKLGVDPQEIVEIINKDSQTCLSVYLSSKAKVDILRRKIVRLDLKNISVHVNTLHQKDWKDRWKEDFKPFALTKRLTVVPIWMKDQYRLPSKRVAVYIDTSMAFGTGLHPTTKFMVQFIERCYPRVNTLFDIGTGTGILAIVALHYGIKKVDAVDFNLDCVKVAKSNLQNNGYAKANVCVKRADIYKISARKQYDFVAANLVTHDLISCAKTILSFIKPGKYLAVSGISHEKFPLLRKAFQPLPLRCLRIARGEKWVGILYKRATRGEI